MVTSIVCYRSTIPQINRETENLLKKIDKLEIGWVSSPAIIEGIIDLPIIHTDEGGRHLGLRGVRSFVRTEKLRRRGVMD